MYMKIDFECMKKYCPLYNNAIILFIEFHCSIFRIWLFVTRKPLKQNVNLWERNLKKVL